MRTRGGGVKEETTWSNDLQPQQCHIQWLCPVCLSLTRDFVLQFDVSHFSPRRQTHSSRPIRGIQLPVGSPGAQTHRLSVRHCRWSGDGRLWRQMLRYKGRKRRRQRCRFACASYWCNCSSVMFYASWTWLRHHGHLYCNLRLKYYIITITHYTYGHWLTNHVSHGTQGALC